VTEQPVAADSRPTVASGSVSRRRYERIYATIRDRICTVDYPPGMRLVEDELAKEFEVSRTPVRRVLARLESEGLLESRHGVGTFVTKVDIEELTQVYKLRMELASLVGRLEPLPRSAEDISRMRRLHERSSALARDPDPRVYARLNMDFFQELSAMTGNLPLRQIGEQLYFRTSRIWLLSIPRLDLGDEIAIFRREIEDILAAMEVGDLEAVGYIRRNHISMSFMRMRRYSADAGTGAG
jgi:DNA-binding GntR family transcriptional regulator